jgi:cholesterol oxidase
MAHDEHFDCVVVGSGFGGSVTAFRLAEAGQRVLVLERGKAYPPGSFPRSPLGLKHNFWDPSEGLHGMFDVWAFSGLDGLVCSGLGGGSLIYANVLLRKDERWFVTEETVGEGYEDWPVTRADLDPHYDRVEHMMNAQSYPFTQSPYDRTAKTIAIKEAADGLGLEWMLPPLAVTFANDGDPAIPGEPIREQRANLHGRTRLTCRLCGECDIGCNYGSKNTLDYTYLTAAWHAGAELRTRCEVREFEPRDGGGFDVHYIRHDEAAEGQPTDTHTLARTTVTTDRLVLSAGTFGSTFLLLRNRAALPGLSGAVGRGFSGNGDLLTFAARSRLPQANGDRVGRVIDPGRGPVITSAVRVPDALDGAPEGTRGFYIEDAGYPEFASWMLQLLDQPHALLRAAPIVAGLARRLLSHGSEEIGEDVSGLFGDCGLSSGVLPLLGMGRDVPDGRMTLKDQRLEVRWSKQEGSRDYFDSLRATAHAIADRLGADFMDNPLWLLDRVITVHPLGGARMGRSDAEGVVDSYGRVFNVPGLHVADGAVMPGPVGANPSMTIAALADRFADAILDGVPEPSSRAPAVAGTTDGAPDAASGAVPGPGAVSVAFTEEMKGFVDFGEPDFQAAFRAGRKSGQRLMFHLTITVDDLDGFIADPEHEAIATGWVESDALGGQRPVEQGQFNLFVDQDEGHDRKRMFYRLPFEDGAGHPLTLVGFKEVRDDPGFDVWSDTTTLFTRVLAGHVEPAQEERATVVATGILRIRPLDFGHQLTTFRVHPATRVDAIGRFGALFAGELWDVYRGSAGR